MRTLYTKKIVLSLSAFIVILFLHASYSIMQSKKLAERWVGMSDTNFLQIYLERAEFLIGASYALAIGFSVYALLRFLENQKAGFTGLLGGITLTGVLYVAGCFLIGCCGSPMLAVYLTLFGSSFLGFTKPLTFGLTLASIVVGYIWMEKKLVRTTECNCEDNEQCSSAEDGQTEL